MTDHLIGTSDLSVDSYGNPRRGGGYLVSEDVKENTGAEGVAHDGHASRVAMVSLQEQVIHSVHLPSHLVHYRLAEEEGE